MSQADLFQQALQRIRAGDRPGARRLLRLVLQADPHSEPAWLWLAACEDDPAEKAACLRQALDINPANETARQALDRLQSPQPGLEDLLWQPRRAVVMAAGLPRIAGRMYLAALAGVLVLILLVGAALVYLTLSYARGCGGAPSSETHTVEYVIEGSASEVLLTYGDGTGNYSQEQAAALPWRKTFTMRRNDQPSISAQSGSDSTNITCQILLDGQPWKSASSNAPYGSVTCSGMVGQP